jgi:hypothetical protein
MIDWLGSKHRKEVYMKRSAIVVLAALCAVALVPSDLAAGVGIKAGYSLARFTQVSTEPLSFTWDYLPFFAGGLYVEHSLLGFLSFQPELLYVRMGGQYEITDFSLEDRLDYIQLPVLLKLNILPAGPVRPFLCAGGYGAYLIKYTSAMVDAGEPDEADLTSEHMRYDYGLVGGGGLKFKLPGISVSIEGRYNYGMMNILKDPAEGESKKNRSIMALVGIGF